MSDHLPSDWKKWMSYWHTKCIQPHPPSAHPFRYIQGPQWIYIYIYSYQPSTRNHTPMYTHAYIFIYVTTPTQISTVMCISTYLFTYICTHAHTHIYIFAQSAGAVEYTDCFSAPTSVLDMTLNNLMVRFLQCWSFGKCGVPLHSHRSQVYSGPEWYTR